MSLEFQRLSKNYGKTQALKDFTYTLHEGIYALLGPNGAGKSTLINILVGLLKPASGTILYDSENVWDMDERFREIIGFMPQYPGFYPDFTAKELLVYLGKMKGLTKKQAEERCLEVLAEVNLSDVKDRKIKTFSGGMKQRVGLAQSLLGNPKILVLDEPTAGLDPKERVRFRNLIRSISRDMIVIFCTHIVSDIESIADEVILLKKGEIEDAGSVASLVEKQHGRVWEVEVSGTETEELLNVYPSAGLMNHEGRNVLRIIAENCPAHGAELCEPCLEDVYMHTFGEKSDVDEI